MLSPYNFLDELKHESLKPQRALLARLALNIYFGAEVCAFDVSELRELTPIAKLTALGALCWAISKPAATRLPLSYKIGGDELLEPATRDWLLKVSEGGDPTEWPPT